LVDRLRFLGRRARTLPAQEEPTMAEQPEMPEGLIDEFLAYLARRGRGSYTARSYRLGLQDFAGWLAAEGRRLDEVTQRDIEAYVDEFARGEKSGARRPDPRRAGVVDLATRQPRPQVERSARTINHRLSVLASFFGFLIERDTGRGDATWAGRVSPVPQRRIDELAHGMPGGGSAPVRRSRAELRRREPRQLPRDLDPMLVDRVIAAASSRRDRAILTLLARSGQRIGDWSDEHGRHGVLGMTLADLDRCTSTVVVRLKGARDEHRVPVTADFWAAFDDYLPHERGNPDTQAAWVGLRRGRGKPLSYSAFEASLRHLGGKLGVAVTAHMFRHAAASRLVEIAGLAVAQEVLGHRHVATTADTYAHVNIAALVRAVHDLEQRSRAAKSAPAVGERDRYAFRYDPRTIIELDAVAIPHLVQEVAP
jgi:integrase/recombinase XerD